MVPKVSGWKNCSKAGCTDVYSDRLDATHNLVLPRTATPAASTSPTQRQRGAGGRDSGARARGSIHAGAQTLSCSTVHFMQIDTRFWVKSAKLGMLLWASAAAPQPTMRALALDSWCCSILFKSGACCLQTGHEYLACAQNVNVRQ